MQNPVSRARVALALFSAVVVWSVVAFLFFERQAVYDWWQLRGYTPPTAIAALADRTTMNSSARRVFYVYHPDIESRTTFNSHCRDGEYTIVLGCYSADKGIFIFDITDTRLQGVEEVTAAHEFLHAAYDRLSNKEREQVDSWTAQAYADIHSQRLRDTIEQYRQHDPAVVPNELHSILGSEVRSLPPALERYYGRYFTNRKQIAAYSEAYEAAFTARKTQAKAYQQQLTALKNQIESENQALETERQYLQSESAGLEKSRTTLDSDTFNNRVDAYNAAVKSYNIRVRRVSDMVDEYNTIYNKYERLYVEQQDLFRAIDSRPQQISN